MSEFKQSVGLRESGAIIVLVRVRVNVIASLSESEKGPNPISASLTTLP